VLFKRIFSMGRLPFDNAQLQEIAAGCKFIDAALWLYFCGQVASALMSEFAQLRVVGCAA